MVQVSQEARLKQHQKVYGGSKKEADGYESMTGSATRYNTNDQDISQVSMGAKFPTTGSGGPFIIQEHDGFTGIPRSYATTAEIPYSSRLRNENHKKNKASSH